MTQPVICAQWDTACKDNTELWHIPRIGNGQPLCGAVVSGRIKKSKMVTPGCRDCVAADTPWILEDHLRECLLLTAANGTARYGDKRWRYDVSALLNLDYVKVSKTQDLLVTSRGKIAVRDLREPAPWWEARRGLMHARFPLAYQTKCAVVLGSQHTAFGTWHLKQLQEAAAARENNAVTCIVCLGARTYAG